MKNIKITFKKTICCALSAAMISMAGYTAAIADEDPAPNAEPVPIAEATASPEPTEVPEEKPTAAPQTTPEVSEMDLRINATVYKDTAEKTYRVVFKTGASLPEISGFSFTAKFDGAVIKGFEAGETFSENGNISRSVKDDSEITCTWENGTAPVSGAVILFTATVESSSMPGNSNTSVTEFTAALPDGGKLSINPDLNVAEGTEIKNLSSEEQDVYDSLTGLIKVENMSFFKEDGTTYNDITTLYLNPAKSAFEKYDKLTDASKNKIDDTLKANGSSITSINSALRAAEAMSESLGIMKLKDAFYGVANDSGALNYEYLKKTAGTIDMTVPTALNRAPLAQKQLADAEAKINEYGGYVDSAVEKLSEKTYDNYNTKIMSLDLQLTSANRFNDHPYYTEYLKSIIEIAESLRSDINANYSGSYKDYMIQSIDTVTKKIESGNEILKNLPTFELPNTFTVGHNLNFTVTRSRNLENQTAYVEVSVYKDGELIDKPEDTEFRIGSHTLNVSLVTNINKYGRNGTISIRCYYKVDSNSYYLGEKNTTIFYSPNTSTFGTGGSSGSGGTGGWSTNDNNSNNGGSNATPRPDDNFDEPSKTQAPSQADSNPYNDIGGYDWAKEAIIGLTNAGIVNGMGDGEFNPAGNVTREQFCKMVVQMYGLDAAETSSYFNDVDEDAWYAPYVTAAVNAGFVQGQSDDYFGIGESIMRQDMATILYRAINMTGDAAELNFTDNNNIADYAKDAVAELVGLGIMNGYEDGSFKPRGSATRAEAAKVIWGIYNLAKY